jgi:hypothetical protein
MTVRIESIDISITDLKTDAKHDYVLPMNGTQSHFPFGPTINGDYTNQNSTLFVIGADRQTIWNQREILLIKVTN